MNRPRSAPPRLHVNSQTRSLNFDSDLVQSSMRLDAPDELVLEYTRAMMSFLLFEPAPAHILMIGLGGGSLVKYCHRHLALTRLTVVEIEQDVIDLRHDFLVPDDDERLQILREDGARFVSLTDQRFNVILVDGFHADGQPAELCTPAFYRHCARALAPGGLLVVNMQAAQPAFSRMFQRVVKVFHGGVAGIAVDDGDNQVVLAGMPALLLAGLQNFAQRWDALGQPHQATLGACSSRLERSLRRIVPEPQVSIKK